MEKVLSLKPKSNVDSADHLERLQLALKSANMGIYEWDFASDRHDWSDETAIIFGHSPGYSPKCLKDVTDQIHPSFLNSTRLAFERALSGNSDYSAEYAIVKPNGSVAWISSRGKIFRSSDNQPIRFVGTVIDVSERRSTAEALSTSELRFRQLAESVPQLVWVVDPEGNAEYFNTRWVEYTGIIESDKVSWEDVIHIDDVEKSKKAWAESVASLSPFDVEYRLKRNKDGAYRWFAARGVPIVDSEGKVSRWFGTCTDIHELRMALNSRDEFLSLASHELKTPLTSLRLQADMLEHAIKTKDEKILSMEGLSFVAHNTNKQVVRLVRLVNDMLDVSRIQSGRFSLEISESDICEIVHESVARWTPFFSQASLTPPLVSAPESVWIKCDRIRIEQVINNLFSNVLKYGGPNRATVTISRSASMVDISVTDSGPGIPIDQVERIFDKFYRAATDREESGLGLGLYIARQIVEAHHGSLTADSKLGKGSTFKVNLPIKI